MEREFLTIIVLILVLILVVVAVSRTISIFLKTPKNIDALPDSKGNKGQYKRIIEKSKYDYKTFFEQKKSLP